MTIFLLLRLFQVSPTRKSTLLFMQMELPSSLLSLKKSWKTSREFSLTHSLVKFSFLIFILELACHVQEDVYYSCCWVRNDFFFFFFSLAQNEKKISFIWKFRFKINQLQLLIYMLSWQ